MLSCCYLDKPSTKLKSISPQKKKNLGWGWIAEVVITREVRNSAPSGSQTMPNLTEEAWRCWIPRKVGHSTRFQKLFQPPTLMKPQVPSQNSSLTHLCYLPAGRPKNAEKIHWRPLKLQHFQKIWDKLVYTSMNLHMTHTQIREQYSTVWGHQHFDLIQAVLPWHAEPEIAIPYLGDSPAIESRKLSLSICSGIFGMSSV